MKSKDTPVLPLRAVLRRMLTYAKPYRFGLVIAICLLAAKLVMDIGLAAVQQLFIDTINSADMNSLVRLTAVCAAVCAFILVCLMLQHYYRFVVQSRMSWDLRAALFDQTHRLPFKQIQGIHSGDLTSRNTKDAEAAMSVVSSIIYDLGYNLLLCFVSFLYLASMDVWLALLALGSGPVSFLSSRFFDRRLRRLSTRIYEAEAQLRGILQETLQGMQIVRAFSLETMLTSKYAAERMKLNQMLRQRALLTNLLWNSAAFINNFVMIICAGFIAYSAINGGTSAGEVLAFIILMGRVQWPFVHMSRTWGGVQQALGAADRVFSILDAPSEDNTQHTCVPTTADSADEAAALSIQGLEYSHSTGPDNDAALFSNLNMSIRHGETVALVGPSGSGKTTLMRLCCGLFQPDAGHISVYGRCAAGGLPEMRSQITYVPQTPYLFSGTISDNIAFGSDAAGEEEIQEAARLAGADEFILKLPEGFNTVIGERGAGLSGGQRQRIAIARAFLRNAPILLLDEATSALDNESEQLVQQSLDLLMKDRTTLVIAHRLSTVRDASRIIVLDKGAVAEEGTHDSLLSRNGLYAELYNLQFREPDYCS
ncbi:ABC transporter ATP-binding protein [Paenibacillus sp. FSL R7-0331]|uniref:ABC transporter ATP-binding protein n=1 Tax=Paenibacillus sp. FSL R7-0331 TaxID=1536773 RepID=UPI0004F85BCD|nr:ABC transporter ATP-binding protein [Paenibacillus sp. FSL R7-0331]AIQ53508.1 hypothetical protein R70331_19565 [Paenibacillus sp. FSL R7-0331]